jgi:hypothetical protein
MIARTVLGFCGVLLTLASLLESSALAAPVDVTGSASLERRMTIVALENCPHGQSYCVASRPYWTLILSQGPERYEVSQMFDVGRETPPDEIVLSTVRIRPGEEVSLQGEAQVVDRSYSIITKVNHVAVIDISDPTGDIGMSSADMSSPFPLYGWSCHGSSSSDDSLSVYASIWHTADRLSDPANCRLRIDLISRGQGGESYPVVSIDRVRVKTDHEDLIYEGSSPELSAELRIGQAIDGLFHPVTGQLRLTRLSTAGDLRFPVETDVTVSCYRTRPIP